MHPYDIIFAGLALDIVGALFLAKGFMLKNPQAAYYESLMIAGGNGHVLKSSLLQRAEAQVGAGLLVLGFLFQIWGNLHGGIAAAQPGWVDSVPRMLLVVMGASTVGLAWWRLASLSARVKFYRIFFRKFSVEAKFSLQANDATLCDRLSLLLDLKRRRRESDAQFLERLETRRVYLCTRYGGQANDFLDSD